MDLASIKTHLDNFVTTWEGWGLVINGLIKYDGLSSIFGSLKNIFEVVDGATYALLSSR